MWVGLQLQVVGAAAGDEARDYLERRQQVEPHARMKHHPAASCDSHQLQLHSCDWLYACIHSLCIHSLSSADWKSCHYWPVLPVVDSTPPVASAARHPHSSTAHALVSSVVSCCFVAAPVGLLLPVVLPPLLLPWPPEYAPGVRGSNRPQRTVRTSRKGWCSMCNQVCIRIRMVGVWSPSVWSRSNRL